MSKITAFLLLLVVGTALTACKPEETSTTATSTASLQPLQVASATRRFEAPSEATPGSDSIGPTATPFVHIIQQGETMLGIALRYGVSLEDLILVNPGVDPGFLTIGKSLRIPGEGGEAIDTLLPTPTPVPVHLGPVECYPAPSGTLTCLFECKNDDADPIRGLTVLVRLFNREGQEIGLQLANAPLDVLLPGQSLPLSAHFSDTPAEGIHAGASILAAIRVPEPAENILLPGENLEWLVEGFNTRLVSVRGSMNLETFSVNDGDIVRIVGRVYGGDGRMTGYQILDLGLTADAGSLVSFDLEIFSLGPPIEAVDLVAEVGH